ncbi:MAG: phosphatase PAP2 family protein, partial [Bacteroidales bacterium]|nr:phosphatase PAP2 family protein [Bacteroidales bacterium]
MNHKLKLLPIEIATFAYIFITAIYLTIFIDKLETPVVHFGVRVGVTVLFLLLAWMHNTGKNPVIGCIRCFLPFALLSYWYPETCYFNDFIFDNLDHHFVKADQILFGCQPSLEFSKRMPWAWFSELMYFGYFSYYFIFFGTALWCYICHKELFNRAIFVFTCSFYLFYMMFAILPVMGPQFYFTPPSDGVPDGYIFCKLMRFLQATGEKPTGAFPSSHVGITFTVVIFVIQHCRVLLKYVLPLFIILVLSTVYIKAHYLVDIIGGFAATAVTYPLVNRLYRKIYPV